MSNPQENTVHMFIITIVFGAAIGVLVMFLALQKESREESPYYYDSPVTVYVEPPTTVTTQPLGEAIIDDAGGAAGNLWADATSPEAKETYGNIKDGFVDGANRFTDSFTQSVDEQRQNQTAP